MVRRRKPRIRTQRYPPRWRRIIFSVLGLAAAAGALVVLAYLNAHGPPKGRSFPDGVVETLTKASVALVLAFVALAVGAWCFRQLWSEWLAWHPGRIEVSDFVASTLLTDVDVAQLTMRFRERLATLHLRAPTPVPGTAPESDFLEVLGRGGVDARNILGSLMNVVRAAKPRHAWQINGVLVKRGKSPRFGVTVQVIRLPNEANPPETVWTTDWDESVPCAADRATAAILPRTRLCKTPWATWRRFVMPGTLLEAYEHAVDLERDRRYDEALAAYYRASSEDPSNMALRLQIGLLQEKMGLFLDALSTYHGISAIAHERDKRRWLPFRRRARARGAPLSYRADTQAKARRLPYRPQARAERRRTNLVATYRRNLLLGGSELAEQWRHTGPADRAEWRARDVRREELRYRLREEVLHDSPKTGDSADAEKAALEEPPPGHAEPDDPSPEGRAERTALFELRKAFSEAALRDLKDVQGRWRDVLRRDRRLVLSRASVDLTELCIEHRLESVKYRLEKVAGETSAHGWPPNAEELDRKIEGVRGSKRFDRWQEHYNAACVYAVPLMLTADDLETRDPRFTPAEETAWRNKLAQRAVARLALAAACTDSGYLAGRRDWLLSEDPDMDGLRENHLFKRFEAMYFPAAAPTPARPRHVQKLEISRYTRDLLVETSDRWERTWHERGKKLVRSPDIHTLIDWWSDECEAWDLVRDVAINRRHWLARLDLIKCMRGWGDVHGFEPLNAAFGRYEDRPLDGSAEAAANESLADDRLDDAAAALSRGNGSPLREELRDIVKWQSTLRQLDAQGRTPTPLIIAVLCDQHAALWQRFREWVGADGPVEAKKRERAFNRQMKEAERWWRSARRWWQNPILVRSVANRAAPGRRPKPIQETDAAHV